MIIETPTAKDFKQASLNLLNLAWRMAVEWLESYEELLEDFHLPVGEDRQMARSTPEQQAEAEQRLWRRAQPALGNALSLIQQAVEMGLKGRIAAVSPFLLIARDARDHPSGSTTKDVPFFAFRTLDAADLLRVHNAVCPERLDDQFATFWDELRRKRNMIIHSVVPAAEAIRPEGLLEAVLYINRTLHPGKHWFDRYREYEEADEVQALSKLQEREVYAYQVQDFSIVLNHLPPRVLRDYFGYDNRGRAYHCPHCHIAGDDHWMIERELGQTAFLKPNKRDATMLHCAVCQRFATVERRRCLDGECKSTVIAADTEWRGVCLLCRQHQDDLAEGDAPETV